MGLLQSFFDDVFEMSNHVQINESHVHIDLQPLELQYVSDFQYIFLDKLHHLQNMLLLLIWHSDIVFQTLPYFE